MEQKERKIGPNFVGETHTETFKELREPLNTVLKIHTSVLYKLTSIGVIVIC